MYKNDMRGSQNATKSAFAWEFVVREDMRDKTCFQWGIVDGREGAIVFAQL